MYLFIYLCSHSFYILLAAACGSAAASFAALALGLTVAHIISFALIGLTCLCVCVRVRAWVCVYVCVLYI